MGKQYKKGEKSGSHYQLDPQSRVEHKLTIKLFNGAPEGKRQDSYRWFWKDVFKIDEKVVSNQAPQTMSRTISKV